MPDLSNALVAEWKQGPAAMFQHPVVSLPWRVEAVIAAEGDQLHINAYDLGMFEKQVSTYFWFGCGVVE